MSTSGRMTELSGDHIVTVSTKTVALGTRDKIPVWTNKTGRTVTITGATFVADTAVTGNSTNYMSLGVKNAGTAGTSNTAISNYYHFVSGTNATALVPFNFTLSSTSASLDVADGEQVFVRKWEQGSGLALPAGLLTIRFKFK